MKRNTYRLLLTLLGLIIVVLILMLVIFFARKSMVNNSSKQQINEDGTIIGNFNAIDDINYELDLSEYKNNDIVVYKLTEATKIKLEYTESEFTFYVNDKKVDTASISNTISSVSILDNYIIIGIKDDTNYTVLYITDLVGNLIKALGANYGYEYSYTINEEGLTIPETKLLLPESKSFKYNDEFYDVCNNELPLETIITEELHYKYENSILDLNNPIIKPIETLENIKTRICN